MRLEQNIAHNFYKAWVEHYRLYHCLINPLLGYSTPKLLILSFLILKWLPTGGRNRIWFWMLSSCNQSAFQDQIFLMSVLSFVACCFTCQKEMHHHPHKDIGELHMHWLFFEENIAGMRLRIHLSLMFSLLTVMSLSYGIPFCFHSISSISPNAFVWNKRRSGGMLLHCPILTLWWISWTSFLMLKMTVLSL